MLFCTSRLRSSVMGKFRIEGCVRSQMSRCRSGPTGNDGLMTAFTGGIGTRLMLVIVGVVARSGWVANVRTCGGDRWLSAGGVGGVGEQP